VPTVSVIIPTHNRSALLQRAMASVLCQTFRDLELVVVDDASSDDTSEIVAKFGDSRVKYIRQATNHGPSIARNTGISHSSGQYIAFLDDDDEWMPEKLQRQLPRLDSSPRKVGVLYTTSLAVDGRSGKCLSRYTAKVKGDVLESMLLHGAVAPTSTFLCRRECFDKVGLFDPSLSYGEDFDMWLRIARDFEFDYIDEPLVRYTLPHTNVSSLSRKYNAVIRGIETTLDRYHDVFVRHAGAHALAHVRLGVVRCLNGEMGKGRAAFVKAIRLNVVEPRAYFNLVLSLLGANAFKKVKARGSR